MEKISIIEAEYNRICEIIENYTNRQINYMNYSILIIGGSFVYLYDKGDSTEISQFYPYMLFLVYGLFANDFYRIQVFAGYRRHLEERLNELLGVDEIKTQDITTKFISDFKENSFYMPYSVFWIGLLIGLYIFSHIPSNFCNFHAPLQLLILGIMIKSFINIPKKTSDKVYKYIHDRNLK